MSLYPIKAICASGLIITCTSLPVAILTQRDNLPAILNSIVPVTQSIKNGYSHMESTITEGVKNAWSQFGTNYQDIETRTKETEDTFSSITSTWQKGESATSIVTKENIEQSNYYLFQHGTVVKEALKYIPTVIRDSVKESSMEKKDFEFLTFKKLSYIFSNEKFNELLPELNKLEKQKSNLLSQISSEDARSIFDILRSLPFEEGEEQRIDSFLGDLKKNISSITSNQIQTYDSTTKLLISIFAGENANEEIQKNLEAVTESFTKLEDSLKGIANNEGDIKEIQELLRLLKEKLPKENAN